MIEKSIVCRKLYKVFEKTAVVQDISFSLTFGDILALLGPSGCGKTTTLRLIAGFERLDNGRIEIAGRIVADEKEHVPPEKRRVGMVFQDYAIFPHLNVNANIAFGLSRGEKSKQRVVEMLEMVGLTGLGNKMPHELSGGQQQRVALARALAPDPAILLLDEPFSNLDTALRAQVREETRALLKQSGATAIFVTHDQEEALFLGDKIAVMNDGRLEQVGSPETIFHNPKTRFVAEFMGKTDFLPGITSAIGVETPLGLLPQPQPYPPGAPVEIALRSDDIELSVDKDGNGRIVGRRFIGIAYIYKIALPNDTFIHCWQPHTMNIPEGTAVSLRFNLEHPLTCFRALSNN